MFRPPKLRPIAVISCGIQAATTPTVSHWPVTSAVHRALVHSAGRARHERRVACPVNMPRQLTPEQVLTPVPSDIAISDAIAPAPIMDIAQAAGIVGSRSTELALVLVCVAAGRAKLTGVLLFAWRDVVTICCSCQVKLYRTDGPRPRSH